jgi:hypothetical protein
MDLGSLFGAAGEGGTTPLVVSIALGLLGMAYFSYGKRLGKTVALGCGVGLMVFPYFVSSTAILLGIGGLLGVLPFLLRS